MFPTFNDAFLYKYSGANSLLNIIVSSLRLAPSVGAENSTGSAPELAPVSWGELSREALQNLRTNLLRRPDLCQNSASQYLARVRGILAEARADGATTIPADFGKLLTVRQFRSHGVYIDNDRLHELENFDVPADIRKDKAQSMRIAKLLALISGRTGARASDVIRFTPSNIRNGMLTYVPKKTKETSGKVCVVPVGPKTTAWIEEVTALSKGIDTSSEKAEKAFYMRYERSLKDICALMPWDDEVVVFEQNEQRVKIFRDCITSHTLRHSFATNMYLDDEVGGDIYSIAQMLGHASVDMTMSYICVPFNEKKMRAVKYFE